MSNTLTFNFYDETVVVEAGFGRYSNGRIAVFFTDLTTGEPFGTLTVNMPEEYLYDDEVFFKDYSGNEALAKAAIDAGWLVPKRLSAKSGFVTIKVAKLAGDLAEAVQNYLAQDV